MVRDESRLGVLAGLQNVSQDFAIQRNVVTLLAGHVDIDRTAGFSRSAVEANRPAFEFEGPVHRANSRPRQGEFDPGLRRVEFEHRFLCGQGEGRGKDNNQGNPNESVSKFQI